MPQSNKQDYAAFLKRLRAAREAAGLTQAAVATRLGRHQSFVAKCESGERRVDAVELEAFATIYKKRFEFFVRPTSSGGRA